MTFHPTRHMAGVELVKRFEGLRCKAARLGGGGWTIGYGHTASAREGVEVTAEEAEDLLLYDLAKIARAVDPLIFTPLDANQYGALLAFAFNVGVDNFRASAVLSRVNEGAYLQAAAALELWRKAQFHGDWLVVDALVRRRAAEKALFLTPVQGFRPIPTAVVRPAFDLDAPDLARHAFGLDQAADLRVSLDGEAAAAEREDAPGGQTSAAVRNVTARLLELVPDRGPADAPPFPAAQAGPDALDLAATLNLEPEPYEPPPAPAAGPVPPFIDPQHDIPPAFRMSGFGRRFARPSGRSGGISWASPARRRFPVSATTVVGLAGAAMFVSALAAMIYGEATLANLAIGLIGVVCMAPAGLQLLLKAFGGRSAIDDDA